MATLILGIGLAVVVAFGIGWGTGTSGKSGIIRAFDTAQLRDSLLEGRAAVLEAVRTSTTSTSATPAGNSDAAAA